MRVVHYHLEKKERMDFVVATHSFRVQHHDSLVLCFGFPLGEEMSLREW